ncbi:Fn3 domain-containing protein [Natranaerovirga hydrolytica]|uniref:Fn3 domain-containing protein n=1 Tax=Natranaerovirga hydrolytica TaxID=680378 RepID=A0A4R1MLJ8_9FIRM|nr:CotH kinase family protein [Natranaerovirga hydrolytica]TCK93405.1 Fn3 domain-containing protein [Natranaerovirga hydrolytica]
MKDKWKALYLAGSIVVLIVLAVIVNPSQEEREQLNESEETQEYEDHINSNVQNGIEFSHLRGFYDAPFFLELEPVDETTIIYYTLDGSTPDPALNPDNTYKYEDLIWIDTRIGEDNILSDIRTVNYTTRNEWVPPLEEIFKGTVLRTAVYRGNQRTEDVTTQTYFVDEEVHNRYTFPIISITTDKENLFDDEKGIYIPGNHYDADDPDPMLTGNYFQRGADWERLAFIEYFKNNQSVLAQNIGIRIHGGSSRSEPQKSLRLYARSDYGNNRLSYPIYEDYPVEEYKRLILRGSGNEWGNTMFLDALAQNIVRDMSFETQESQPSIAFINGEYWGIHNIRERYDHWYFNMKYDVPTDDVVILTGNATLDTGVDGDQQHYLDMLGFIETNDIRDEENYEYVKTLMDVDNYIEYQLAQIYFANIDWPQGNIDFWRKRTDGYDPDAPYGHDGRWRWLMFDLDCSFGYWGTSYQTNSMEMASDPDYNHNGSWGGEWQWATFLFSSLLENEDFKNQFINTFADHLNTTFLSERIINEIDSFQALYEPEIQEHMKRWGKPESMDDWYESIDVFRTFARRRSRYVRSHIVERFDLSGEAYVEIKASDDFEGIIRVNSLEVSASDLPYSGYYFKDVPITIEVVPTNEEAFSGWTGDVESDDKIIEVNLEKDNNILMIQ